MLIISCAVTLLYSQTDIPGGNVNGFWNIAGSPYLIQGDITIPLSSALSIEPGVEVQFLGNYSLRVRGHLEAVGSESDSIRFTKADSGPGWDGIRFIDAPDGSIMSYCIIEEGNASGSYPDNRGGAIYIEETNPLFTHCSIRNNTASFGGGVYAVACSPVILYTVFQGNTASNYGGAVDLLGANAVIENCTFYSNDAAAGGAISIDLGTPLIRSCNITGTLGTCGIYFQENSSANLTHCDFFGNAEYNFLSYVPAGLGDIVLQNANGDSCDIFYNIYLDPLFTDPAAGNFRLSGNSPCIDAGSPDSEMDPDGTIADIGAFSYLQTGDCFLPGDLNLDGSLDVLDVVLAVNCILQAGDCSCADLDENGNVNILDVVMMISIILI